MPCTHNTHCYPVAGPLRSAEDDEQTDLRGETTSGAGPSAPVDCDEAQPVVPRAAARAHVTRPRSRRGRAAATTVIEAPLQDVTNHAGTPDLQPADDTAAPEQVTEQMVHKRAQQKRKRVPAVTKVVPRAKTTRGQCRS